MAVNWNVSTLNSNLISFYSLMKKIIRTSKYVFRIEKCQEMSEIATTFITFLLCLLSFEKNYEV